MRTTLTIDDDVASLLKKEMRRSGNSFKETVNRYLRLGLTSSKDRVRKPFVVEPFTLGLSPGINHDKVNELLDGPEHKLIVPDVNILLYAYDTASPKHKAARAWLQ